MVLAYICNESTRFQLFVANRVKFIRVNSQLSQWMYVPTKQNPADDVSRGLKLSQSPKDERWLYGPDFLQQNISEGPRQPRTMIVPNDDKEF